MSSGNWGIEAFVWHDPAVYVRWHTHSDGIIQLPPLQVQGIPGEYINHYYGVFTREGTWYVTNGDGDNPPGVVFRASYPDGIYHEIARLPDRNGGAYSILPYPGGLVAMQEGTRWVYLVTANGGITMSQELPQTPTGDVRGFDVLRLLLVCYVPDPLGVGKISIAVGMNGTMDTAIVEPGDATTDVVGAVYSELTVPGAQFVMRPEFVIVPRFTRARDDVEDGCWRLASLTPSLYNVRNTMCVTGSAHDRDSMYNIVEASADIVYTYRLMAPDEATPPDQQIGLLGVPATVEYLYDDVWPGSESVGNVYGVRSFPPGSRFVPAPPDVLNVIGGSYYYGGALVWAPAPIHPPFWTSFVRTIEPLEGEFLPPQPDPDPDPDPDPTGAYVDFVVTAGDGGWVIGFIDWSGTAAGSVVPASPVFGGVTGVSRALAWGDGYLVAIVDGVYGVSGAVMVIGGSEFRLDIHPNYTEGVQAMAPLSESPFEVGQTYDIRLYLEGDLRDTY